MNERSTIKPTSGTAARAVKIVLGLLVSGLFLYATLATVPFGEVMRALGDADFIWIVAGFGCVAVAYFLKVVRSASLLRGLGSDVRISAAAVPFVGGVALNNVLPLRAGDIFRVVGFQRLTGLSPAGQLGVVVLERLLDLLVLMALLFATISFWSVDVLDEMLLRGLRLVAAGTGMAIILFLVAPLPLRLIVRWVEARLPRLQRIGSMVLRLSDAVSALSRPGLLARAVVLSIFAWLAEGGVFFAVGFALGLELTPQAGLLALCVGTLSTLIPSSPGYVGTFHFFTARVISAFGIGQAPAAAYAILVHALLWLSTTAAGFLLLLVSGFGTASRSAAVEAQPR